MSRSARRRPAQPAHNPLGWMFTFSDVVTLILTFFVMMLAMRHPDLAKYQAAFSDQDAPRVARQAVPAPPAEGAPPLAGGQVAGRDQLTEPLMPGNRVPVPPPEVEQGSASQAAADLDLPGGPGGLPSGSLQAGLNLREDPRGTVITIANDLLFAPGSATLSPQAAAELRKVAALLRHGRQQISVEGHSDDAPLTPGRGFRDNWELSLARAVAVAQRLIADEGLPAGRVRVAALAGTRPLVANDTPEHRAMNRRTEIIILNLGG